MPCLESYIFLLKIRIAAWLWIMRIIQSNLQRQHLLNKQYQLGEAQEYLQTQAAQSRFHFNSIACLVSHDFGRYLFAFYGSFILICDILEPWVYFHYRFYVWQEAQGWRGTSRKSSIFLVGRLPEFHEIKGNIHYRSNVPLYKMYYTADHYFVYFLQKIENRGKSALFWRSVPEGA